MSAEKQQQGSAVPSEALFKALTRSEIVREWIEALHKATGLTIKLVAADPSVTVPALSSRENPFCSLVAHTYASRLASEKPRVELARRLTHNLVPQRTRCFAGFTHVAVPVVIGSTHVATLLAGQVFTHQPTPRLFRAVREQLRKVGLDDEVPRLRRAWLKTRVIPANRLATSVHLLVLLVRLIAECAERWVMCAHETDPPCIARAKEFIERHAHEAMSLEDVTEHVHFCPQYFCKLFKKATGLSFTQYLSRVRVERAKQLLLDPSLRIKEAAFKAGFRSLRRFEEVFRAHTGFSPLHYRAKIPRR